MLKKNLKIGFAGLTHLGTVYAVAASEKKFKVVAFHEDEKIIKNLNNFDISYFEPNLKKILKKNKKNIFFSYKYKDLKLCDIVFVSYDTNTDKFNNSDLKSLKKKINKLIPNLKKTALLVILSQVKPGFTRKINWPKKQLFYQVETLVFGKALKRAINPERIIIGAHNESLNNKKIIDYFSEFSKNLIFLNYETAEITKISINLLLISNITASNLLSEICEKNNADWSQVEKALRLDKRIGKNSYIRPGLGITGGNLERDLQTINLLCKDQKLYLHQKIVNEYINFSNYRKNWIADIVSKLKKKNNKSIKIGLLGLTYKENTNSIKNSCSIDLIKKFNKDEFFTYDPKASKNIKFKNIKRCENMNQVILKADIIIIATPWREFRKIKIDSKNCKYLIDPFGIFQYKANSHHFGYFTMGKNL